LDNGFRSCEAAEKLQKICDALGPEQIDRFFRKWRGRLPLPLRRRDREAGYEYQLSIWQMEVSLTQVFDRPVFQRGSGGAHRDHDRQHRGLGRQPRPIQFAVPAKVKLGRQINRRLLEVERVSHNCGLGGDSIQRVVQPTVNEDGQKAPGLRFGQPRVMALWVALTMFQHLINGFHNRDLRQHVADLLGMDLHSYSANQMTYDLRRLLRKGVIFRGEGTNRYFLTPFGWKIARLFARLESQVFRPAVAAFGTGPTGLPPPLLAAVNNLDTQFDALIGNAVPLKKVG